MSRYITTDKDDDTNVCSWTSFFMKQSMPPIRDCITCGVKTRDSESKTGLPRCWCCCNPVREHDDAKFKPINAEYVPITPEQVYAWIDLRASIVARGGYLVSEIGKGESDKMFQAAHRLKIHVPLYSHRRGKKITYKYRRYESKKQSQTTTN